jgi:hypothetical protein
MATKEQLRRSRQIEELKQYINKDVVVKIGRSNGKVETICGPLKDVTPFGSVEIKNPFSPNCSKLLCFISEDVSKSAILEIKVDEPEEYYKDQWIVYENKGILEKLKDGINDKYHDQLAYDFLGLTILRDLRKLQRGYITANGKSVIYRTS